MTYRSSKYGKDYKIEKQIGVSYTSKNKEQLDKIENVLFSLGISVVRYDKLLEVKGSIQQFMKKLVDLDINLLLLSKDYFNSPFCIYELAMLVKKPEKLIVIYLEDEISVEDLLCEEKGKVIQGDSQLEWLNQELLKIKYEDVINSLSYILSEKYLLFSEIISKNGIKQLLSCLKYTPENYIKQLECILEEEDFYEREQQFIEYLEVAPPNEIYNYYKAISYEKQEYIKGAVFFLNQAIKQNSTYTMAYIRLLDLSIKHPEKVSFDERVLSYLENELGLSEQDKIVVWKAKGMFLFHNAKKEKAIERMKGMRQALECFLQAKQLCANQDATIYNNLGLVYEELGDIDAAASAYESAIEKFPQYYQALNNLALLYDKYYDDVETARQLYEMCLQINPHYTIARSNYALLMEKIDITIALEMDLHMLCTPHERTDFITNMALILEEEGISKVLAGILYKIMLEKKPESLSAKFNMGNFLRREGNAYDEVCKYLYEVNEKMPNNDMVLISLTLLEMRENNIDKALEFCDEAIRCNPKYVSAIFLRGYLEEKKGIPRNIIISKIDRFINFIKKDKGDNENKFVLLYNLVSILYLKEGNIEQARIWEKLASTINSRFINNIDRIKPDYGIDILEYEYTHCAKGRINKDRLENLMIDSHKETLTYLLSLINKDK